MSIVSKVSSQEKMTAMKVPINSFVAKLDLAGLIIRRRWEFELKLPVNGKSVSYKNWSEYHGSPPTDLGWFSRDGEKFTNQQVQKAVKNFYESLGDSRKDKNKRSLIEQSGVL